MKKLKFYLNRIYRLTLSFQKQEELVWNDLKRFHSEAEWQSGVYENDKSIETIFEIGQGKGSAYCYNIYDVCFHSRVKIIEQYPVDLTTDLFILAAHFNNILNWGVVIVNVNENYIEYHQKRDLLIPLLYYGEINNQITNHYEISKDIYSAFKRLTDEQEAPAIIIADLLKEKSN